VADGHKAFRKGWLVRALLMAEQAGELVCVLIHQHRAIDVCLCALDFLLSSKSTRNVVTVQ
jgi:hypothetical protein